MKTKTINAILCGKFKSFAASITDPAIKALVENNTIITGGCIVSMLQKENVNDYDLYFRNEATALAVAKYYASKFKEANAAWDVEAVSKDGRVTISVNKSNNVSVAGSAPEEEIGIDESLENIERADALSAAKLEDGPDKDEADNKRYQPLFLSSNAITLSTKVQLIIRFYGEPDEIHENYDFVHCTSYWTSWNKTVTLRPQALEAIITKELRYVGSRHPICSLIRTRKFIARGWTINAGQFVKMAWQVSKLDLNDIEVLKDQLVGVDSLYFSQLISRLEKHRAESGEIHGDYVMTIIDKIF